MADNVVNGIIGDGFSCGLAGLNAGLKWIEEQGIEKLREDGKALMDELISGVKAIPGIHVYADEGQVLSITIDNLDNGEAAAELEDRWGIMTRIGLHCAPLAHHTLGTFPNGTIRFAVSPFTTHEQIQRSIQACRTLAEETWQKR